ncbi:MAG: glycosyl hydrolase family 18 protein, partial [Lentisphaerota bacterium]
KSSMNLYPDGTVMSASDTTNWPLFDGVPNYAYLKNNSKGWTKVWDSKAKVPYMVKGNYFLSYDDPQSIKEKADYVVLNGAGGVIVWQVFGDMEFSGAVTVAPGGKLPKATTVKTELLDALYSNMNK